MLYESNISVIVKRSGEEEKNFIEIFHTLINIQEKKKQ